MVLAIFLAIEDVGRAEIDVVGDQEFAGADDGRTGGGMDRRRPRQSGVRAATVPISSTRASNWPRRMFSRFVRSGRLAAAS